MAVAKAVTRISSEMPTYGARVIAHTAAYEMGRPSTPKRSGEYARSWT